MADTRESGFGPTAAGGSGVGLKSDLQPPGEDAAPLDTRGLCCPEPVMLLHGRVRAMQPGELLTVIATDPSTQRDIPRFCEFLGHALLESSVRDGEFVYRIRKGG